MYAGPFGYDGAAPPILDRTADDTPSPLLPAEAVLRGGLVYFFFPVVLEEKK